MIKHYKIFNKNIANELLSKGFLMIDAEINHKDNSKVVYIFKYTDNFKIELNNIMKSRGIYK